MTDARFVVLGPAFHGYTRAVASALTRLGGTTSCLEFEYGHDQSAAGIILYYGRKFLRLDESLTHRRNTKMVNAICAFRPHIVVIIKGDWLTRNVLASLKEKLPEIQIVLWAQDSIVNIPSLDSICDFVDLLAVFEQSDLDRALTQSFASAMYLPAAYDSECYHPLSANSITHDLTFVGAAYPARLEFLERVGMLLESARLRLSLVGNFCRPNPWSKWRLHRSVPHVARSIVARSLSPDQVNHLYANSAAVLNIHHEQSRKGFNPRTVEIMASGRPQLLDRQRYLGPLFPPEECVLYYDSPEDAVQQLKRLASSPELQRRLASNALEFARPHSMNVRMAQLLDRLSA